MALAWQVDIRAEGGYIIAPTTRTSQGRYEPQGPARTPAVLPEWLHAELVRTGHVIAPPPPRRPPNPASRSGIRRRPATAHRLLEPLLQAVAQCASAPEGTGFTEKLNRAAYTAGGLAAAGHIDHDTVRQSLLHAASQARPWQGARNEQITDDGLAAGAARPFHPEGRP